MEFSFEFYTKYIISSLLSGVRVGRSLIRAISSPNSKKSIYMYLSANGMLRNLISPASRAPPSH